MSDDRLLNSPTLRPPPDTHAVFYIWLLCTIVFASCATIQRRPAISAQWQAVEHVPVGAEVRVQRRLAAPLAGTLLDVDSDRLWIAYSGVSEEVLRSDITVVSIRVGSAGRGAAIGASLGLALMLAFGGQQGVYGLAGIGSSALFGMGAGREIDHSKVIFRAP